MTPDGEEHDTLIKMILLFSPAFWSNFSAKYEKCAMAITVIGAK
jgi:hypothetical protein